MVDVAQSVFEDLFGPEFGHGRAFDLGKLRGVLEALDAPHRSLPPVIHVAGTNGKGSTIAFMRAITEAAGLRVHAFTKPHLFCLNERFILAGEPVSDERLIATAKRVAAVSRDITQFDAQAAAAFLLFNETPADLVLLETGMGGRDDSTNVIEAPALSVVTPIALDHQDALGATLGDIAAHKAGILKANAPAIIARQCTEATMRALEARAEEVGAPLFRAGIEWGAHATHGRLVVQTEYRALDLPLPALHGAHQIDNAGLACAALLRWRADLPDEAFAQGVANATWPARLHPLTRGALSAPIRGVGGEVWVDGGHNAHALAALQSWAVSAARQRKAPLVIVFAARPRKNWAVALRHLAMMAERVIAIPLPDGVDPQQIADHANSDGGIGSVTPSLSAAMQNAAQLAAPRVLICGSLALAAEALAAENA